MSRKIDFSELYGYERGFRAIPTITWGKYVEKDGKLELGMSIEVNHRLSDGYHIGQFAQEREKSIDMLY